MFRVDARFKTDKQILMEFYSHHRVMASAVSFENIETGTLHHPEHTCRLTLPAAGAFRGEVIFWPCMACIAGPTFWCFAGRPTRCAIRSMWKVQPGSSNEPEL